MLACVNETLAEASALGLPDEILQLIESCKVRLSVPGVCISAAFANFKNYGNHAMIAILPM